MLEPYGNLILCSKDNKPYLLLNNEGKKIMQIDNGLSFEKVGKYLGIKNKYGGLEQLYDINGNLLMEDIGIDFEGLKSGKPVISGRNTSIILPTRKVIDLGNSNFIYSHPNSHFFAVSPSQYDLPSQWNKVQYYDFNFNAVPVSSLPLTNEFISFVKKQEVYYFQRKNPQFEGFGFVHPMFWINGSAIVSNSDNEHIFYLYGNKVYTYLNNPSNIITDATHVSGGYAIVRTKDTKNNIMAAGDGKMTLLMSYDGSSVQDNEWTLQTINGHDLIVDFKNHLILNPYTQKSFDYVIGNPPIFQDGLAVTSDFPHSIIDTDFNIITKGMDIKTSEGLVIVNDGFSSFVYDIAGNLLIDGSKLGISNIGTFNQGVANALVSGSQLESGCYVYNTFTPQGIAAIEKYGYMGKVGNINEINDLVLERAECVSFLLDIGADALSKQNFKKAREYFQRVYDLDYSNQEANMALGYCYMHDKNYEQAVHHFELCELRNLESRAQINELLANCYFKCNNFRGAKKAAEKALKYDGNSQDAKRILAISNNILQETAEKQRIEEGNKFNYLMNVLSGFNQLLQCANDISMTFARQRLYNEGCNTNYPSRLQTIRDSKSKCDLCGGTGYNPAKERPSFYSYSEDDHIEKCDVCGERSNHYHKPCPACSGGTH